MVDPVIHAEMTILVRREKELNEKARELADEEIPLWKRRVGLAEQKGMSELAQQAGQRVLDLKQKLADYSRELDSIDMQKSMLRKQSRRPSGDEVARAENMVEQVRLAGLVDPDRSDWDELEDQEDEAALRQLKEESGAVLDFSSDE